MKMVQDALSRHVDEVGPITDPSKWQGPLGEVAEKWAVHALRTYNSDLLEKALAVSKALAEFDNELNQNVA